MRRALALVFLCSCDGIIGELGEAERPPELPSFNGPRITKLECAPLTGDAPLKVTCQLEVVHPGGKPASCDVDPGNGTQGMTVADCLNPQTIELTFDQPGSYTMKVLAHDPETGRANATVAVVANLRPNQPPVIDELSASPATGGAPFTSTLTWKLTDPDGDALTCKLNETVVDCAALTAPWTVQMPGTQMVTLTVTDAFGASVSKTITLTAIMPVGDVRISKVEWAQTVVLPDLRLVAQKPALLRVHVLGDKAGHRGVTVEASGKLGTTDLGKLTLVGPQSPPTAEAPADLTQQWTVFVPAEWVDVGLEVSVKIDAADALAETDEANNVQVLKPLVGKANVMRLTAVPVVHQGTMPTVTNLEGPLTRIWPLKGVESMTRAPYTYGGTLSATGTQAWGNLLDDIAELRQMDGSNRNYYGWVRVGYGSGVAGIGFIGQEAAVGRDDSIQTAQHELGHNLGRQHAPCGGVAGPDPQYPYANARLGSWGYDAVGRRLINPTSNVDLMSYCSPEWVSDYNYKAVQRFLETQPYIAPSSAPYVATVAVSGRFTASGVTLRPVHRVHARLPAEQPFTGRMLRVRFANGAERVVSLAAHEIADLAVTEESFFALVEDLGPIAAIEIFSGATRVLHERPVLLPEAAPKVKLTRVSEVELRVEWDAARYPYAAVAHLTADARTTLALALEGGSARVRIDGLGAGRIELSLSQGLDAASLELPLPAR